jgi:hypothetical protein
MPSTLEDLLTINPNGYARFLATGQAIQDANQRQQAIDQQQQFLKDRAALGPDASPDALKALAERNINDPKSLVDVLNKSRELIPVTPNGLYQPSTGQVIQPKADNSFGDVKQVPGGYITRKPEGGYEFTQTAPERADAAPSVHVVQDPNSPTGWSHQDFRTGEKKVGAPPPASTQQQLVVPPEQAKNQAVMRATGMPAMQVMPGYARNMGAARSQLNQDAINYIAQTENMTPQQAAEELANRDISYAGGKKSVGQLTTMLGATRAALNQLDFNVDKVSQVIKSMPGSDLSPVINAIIRGEQKWTGDPRYSALFYYMNAAGMESARILSNGQASIAQLHTGAAEEAKKWADADWTTPKAWLEGVAPAMKAEAENRITNFTEAIKAQRSRASASPTAPSAAPSSFAAMPVMPEFATEADAAKANLKPGTKVKIGGKTGTWQ